MKLINKIGTRPADFRSVRAKAIGSMITLIGVLGGPGDAQQASPAQEGELVLRTITNLVLVDVRVLDKSGRTVPNLKREHFKVSEDGQPQTISFFSFENIQALDQSDPTAPRPVVDVDVRTRPRPSHIDIEEKTRNRRLLVLFFDLTSMPPEDVMRALKAATEFVERQMTPADLVSLVAYTPSLRVLEDFTNQRAYLLKALRQIRPGESAALTEIIPGGEAEFNIFNTDQKLAAIESLARMLGEVPGRKAVVHFSSGITLTGNENQAQLRAAVDAANQANVSIYTVDARGLVALPPLGDASASAPKPGAVYSGEAFTAQIGELLDSRETLAALAHDTGGRDFYDLNDFAYIFEQIRGENSDYYLLGYYASNSNVDGRFRRLRVELDPSALAARELGVRVQHRPGYFAPKDFAGMARGDRERQLEHALNLENPFVELPLAVETLYFRLAEAGKRRSGETKSKALQAAGPETGMSGASRPNFKYFVVLSAKIPGTSVPFEGKGETRQTEFDFVWRVLDSHGNPAAMLRDTLPVKIDRASYERLLKKNLLYQGGIVLPPGKYDLKVVVRENLSGKMGTFEHTLNLPDPASPDLALSSVVVSSQVVDTRKMPSMVGRTEKGKIRSPLLIGDRWLLPSVTKVFYDNQPLYVYLQAYEVGPGGDVPRLQPQAGVVFFQGNWKVAELGPFASANIGQQDTAAFLIEIPTERLPPGRYHLQVNVLDLADNRAAFARLPIVVLKSGSSSPQVPVGN